MRAASRLGVGSGRYNGFNTNAFNISEFPIQLVFDVGGEDRRRYPLGHFARTSLILLSKAVVAENIAYHVPVSHADEYGSQKSKHVLHFELCP